MQCVWVELIFKATKTIHASLTLNKYLGSFTINNKSQKLLKIEPQLNVLDNTWHILCSRSACLRISIIILPRQWTCPSEITLGVKAVGGRAWCLNAKALESEVSGLHPES